jgi:hypothetical protein
VFSQHHAFAGFLESVPEFLRQKQQVHRDFERPSHDDQVMMLLIEACPSYHLPPDDQELLYVTLGDFARHLLQLFQQGRTQDFPEVACVIERPHVEGDGYVREAATIGLLEGIQNVWANEGTDPELYFPYLHPVSAKWWQSLNDFWSGKSKFVGEGL